MVRLYVGYLRQKIEVDPSSPKLIETTRGFLINELFGHVLLDGFVPNSVHDLEAATGLKGRCNRWSGSYRRIKSEGRIPRQPIRLAAAYHVCKAIPKDFLDAGLAK